MSLSTCLSVSFSEKELTLVVFVFSSVFLILLLAILSAKNSLLLGPSLLRKSDSTDGILYDTYKIDRIQQLFIIILTWYREFWNLMVVKTNGFVESSLPDELLKLLFTLASKTGSMVRHGELFTRKIYALSITIRIVIEQELSMLVQDAKESNVTFEDFPYYLSERTRMLLTSAAYVHLKHLDVSRYTRNLSPASRAILLTDCWYAI